MTPDEAEQWCEVDLFAAFPPRESVNPAVSEVSRRGHGMLKILDLFLPVLVFVPIAVTWYGLKEATSAYGETLAAGGIEAARRPFLEMWQQGFDGRLPAWLQFDGVAFMTLSAIVLLVAVTLGERLLRRSIEQQAEEQVDALRARLLAALTRATLVLAQVRLSSPVRFQAELTKSAAEMHKLGETTRTVYTKVVEALDLALEAAGQASDALTAGFADMRGSIESLDKQVATVASATETLLRAVERTAYAVDSVGEKTDEAIDRVGDRLSRVILDSTTAVRKSVDELATLTAQAVGDMATSAGRVVDELATSTRQTVRELTHSTDRAVRDTAASLDVRVGELVSVTADLGSAVGRVETAADESGDRISRALTDANGTIAATLGSAGTEVREALDDWAGTASAHAARIEMVSDTAGRTVRLLEETRAALDRLPADLARALQEVPSAVREVTAPEIAGLQAAIARLDDAVRQAAAAVTTGLAAGAAVHPSPDTAAASGGHQ
ncbi:hypothetical protein [Nonomuraea glycinis]|uniref:hypothetical protein n=1 Tax=Nonomuraea glycinis TaxID=2047744 RepID=UPI002E12BE74|nr:hypothetical protein OHA68_40080 [Nonomuraea glycinis]